MNPKDYAIDAKLQAIAKATPKVPWYDGWVKLTATSPIEERVAVYQTIRRSGSLPEEASFFIVVALIEDIALTDDGLNDNLDQVVEMVEKYRMRGSSIWVPGTAPDGYDELEQQHQTIWNNIFTRKLQQFGELQMARLFCDDRVRFDQLREAGREYFFGPKSIDVNAAEPWLHQLVEVVARCMKTMGDPMGPLNYRHRKALGHVMVDIYGTPIELLGGMVDGEVVTPSFSLDIEQLRRQFSQIDLVTWQSMQSPKVEGSLVAVAGVYEGHQVFVQVMARAPEDEEPGMKLPADVAR